MDDRTNPMLRDISRRGFLKLGVAGATVAGISVIAGCSPAASPSTSAGSEPPASGAAPYKVGFAYIGPIADNGWTFTHNEARLEVEKAYPNVKTSYVELVPLSPDGTVIFRQLAQDNDMVIVNSSYGDLLLPVVTEFPNVLFMEAAGTTSLPNLQPFLVQAWKPAYIMGVAAGKLSGTGKLGYVGAFPSNSAFLDTTMFLAGARTVNPNATLQAVMINSFIDPPKATQAANALIDGGVDVMFDIQDDTSVIKTCQERGVWSCIWNRDNRDLGPDVFVNCINLRWDDYYVSQIGSAMDGAWKSTGQIEFIPFPDGADIVAPWGAKVPKEAADAGDGAHQEILDGFNPFTGPMNDSTGRERIPAGKSLTDVEIYAIDWVLEGVQGVL